MKTKHFLSLTIAVLLAYGFTACNPNDEVTAGKKWVTAFQNITLGNQFNTTNGHFLKLKTGESVKLENVGGQEQYMAFMIFTDYGGNCNITFPADAADATAYPSTLATNRLFTQASVGLNYWDAAKMVNGMIYKVSDITAADFNNLVSSKNWTLFDTYFKKCNGDQEYLGYKLHYDLTPTAGNIYLLQFNKLVRAIMYAKSYVAKADGSSAYTFDIVVESRSENANLDLAKYLQP